MRTTKFIKSKIHREPKDHGKSIEEVIRQAIATKQPIGGEAPMIYTPAKDGVLPQYDIRTDKHDLALAANSKYQASEHMKGFIGATEYDENGFDGNGNKRENNEQKTE